MVFLFFGDVSLFFPKQVFRLQSTKFLLLLILLPVLQLLLLAKTVGRTLYKHTSATDLTGSDSVNSSSVYSCI